MKKKILAIANTTFLFRMEKRIGVASIVRAELDLECPKLLVYRRAFQSLGLLMHLTLLPRFPKVSRHGGRVVTLWGSRIFTHRTLLLYNCTKTTL